MKRILLGLLVVLATQLHAAAAAASKWLDQSHEIFLTQKMSNATSHFRDLPVFWWNFVVIDGDLANEQSEEWCRELQRIWEPSISKLPCHFGAHQLQALTRDWMKDLPLRRALPTPPQWQHSMNSLLVKASLPLPRELLELLRHDPLNTLSELKSKLDERKPFNLPMQNGMIFDQSKKQIWLPVQFNFSPAHAQQTRELLQALKELCARLPGCRQMDLFGPHASTLENESRIRADINVVSLVGVISLLLLSLFVVLTRRHRLVLLIPILLLGLLIAALGTVLVFGKIHGITLAFGPGIVGLAMDYGVHAVFLDPRSKSTWRSNLAGLLTTLVVLLILLFSEIPLLPQMMFFSAFGLCISFLLFFFCLHRYPHFFATQPYSFTPKTWAAGQIFAVLLLLMSPLIFTRPLDLTIQHLNYESGQTRQHREWFLQHSTSINAYWLEENFDDPLYSAGRTKKWADSLNIGYEGVANFLPDLAAQEKNLKTWSELCLSPSSIQANPLQKQFFAPFFTQIDCTTLRPRDIKSSPPDYLRDFVSGEHWASLLFPSTPEQVAALKQKFPTSTTPREIFSEFPRIFLQELAWMVPLALFAALFFLWFHFRHFRFTLLSVVPFLTGVGCFALVAFLFNLPVSFISLIGLLMVFGFSLDYGIFVVDLLREHNENRFGVWSALSICSFSALAGFAPLVFAGHPVLNDLGQTLLWGSLGTYIGTFWGIPGLFRWSSSLRETP